MGTTALLVLDIQNGVVGMLEHNEAYLDLLARTITSTRAAGHKIIYVTTGFRPGYPEVSDSNDTFARVKGSGVFIAGDASTQVHAAVAPEAGDIQLTKRRVSAFHATDLDLVLRSLAVETVVVAGLSTSGAVLSTVQAGADLDYKIIVLEDLCMDREEEVHDVLMGIFAKQGRVLPAEEWVAALE